MHPLWYTAGEGDKYGRKGLFFVGVMKVWKEIFIYFKWMKSFSHMYSCLYP